MRSLSQPPTIYTLEPVVAALERGLHVLVEKPLTISGKDARRVLSAAESSGKVCMVAYDDLFNADCRTVKEAIGGGVIGTIRQVSAVFSKFRHFFWEERRFPEETARRFTERFDPPEGLFDLDLSTDWRSSFKRNGGGTFSNAGNHDVNLALWLDRPLPRFRHSQLSISRNRNTSSAFWPAWSTEFSFRLPLQTPFRRGWSKGSQSSAIRDSCPTTKRMVAS